MRSEQGKERARPATILSRSMSDNSLSQDGRSLESFQIWVFSLRTRSEGGNPSESGVREAFKPSLNFHLIITLPRVMYLLVGNTNYQCHVVILYYLIIFVF